MNSDRRKTIGAKLRTAGSSGKKAHVISRKGRLVIFKEGSDKVLSEFMDKRSAITSGKKILKSGKIEALVLHKADATVEKVQLAH